MRLKKLLRLAVLIMCISWLLTLLGCEKGKPQMLDGPGMEYQSPWTAFTITRSDSNAQYNFWFEVTETDDGAEVTGSCRDEDGMEYETEAGIPVSGEDLWKLRWMDLDQLGDEEPWIGELEPTQDQAEIILTLTFRDGTVEKRNASGELSMEIYEILLPYLKNS